MPISNMTGRWVEYLPDFMSVFCTDYVQSGTVLTATPCDMSGSGTEVIDPMTGVFGFVGPPSGVCPPKPLEAFTAQLAPDGLSYTGTLTFHISPETCEYDTSFTQNGVRAHCGDHYVDPDNGEQCDDGNNLDGDCCSATCQFESGSCDDHNVCTTADTCSAGVCTGTPGPPGVACPDDGNQCTSDLCDGNGVCGHATLVGASCDDGNACTDADTCVDFARCVGTAKPNGTSCDDRDPCTTGDACQNGVCRGGPPLQCPMCSFCDGSAGCVNIVNGTTCDDGDPCTSGDTCSGGMCSGTPVACAPCLACAGTLGCVPAPNTGCKQAGTSSIRLRDFTSERLTWMWRRGDLTSQQDLGDPQSTTDYALCVYDGTVDQHGNPGLLLQSSVPAGPAWSSRAKGLAYVSEDQLPNGISGVRLKPGPQGKVKVLVTGKGPNLNLPPLQSIALPITVQLQAGNGLACWESSYPAATSESQHSFTAGAP